MRSTRHRQRNVHLGGTIVAVLHTIKKSWKMVGLASLNSNVIQPLVLTVVKKGNRELVSSDYSRGINSHIYNVVCAKSR